jgi:hypothetical protein
MMSENEGVTFEESNGRLKVVIPVRFNWLLFGLYTFGLVIWLVMLVAVLTYLLRGLSSSIVLTFILILWLIVWFWFGRFLTNRWQYQAANREILFINGKELIHRRPVSIFGLTNSYDIRHVSPFYFSENHSCPAFDYAFTHVYFGQSLDQQQAKELIDDLNQRYFPETVVDE